MLAKTLPHTNTHSQRHSPQMFPELGTPELLTHFDDAIVVNRRKCPRKYMCVCHTEPARFTTLLGLSVRQPPPRHASSNDSNDSVPDVQVLGERGWGGGMFDRICMFATGSAKETSRLCAPATVADLKKISQVHDEIKNVLWSLTCVQQQPVAAASEGAERRGGGCECHL